MSALRVGADLSLVFCTRGAGPVIKSYSPELIVHPVLPVKEESGENSAVQGVEAGTSAVVALFPRLDALVVGPGMGRDESVLATAEAIVSEAVARRLPLVIDGDGLFLVCRRPGLISRRDASRVVLTPNVNEFSRLWAAVHGGESAPADASDEQLRTLSRLLGGAVVVRKGGVDCVASSATTAVLRCAEEGSLRRCGGQGDVLAGTISVFVAWSARAKTSDLAQAVHTACAVCRRAAKAAFAVKKRSMVASDLIEQLGGVMEELAPVEGH